MSSYSICLGLSLNLFSFISPPDSFLLGGVVQKPAADVLCDAVYRSK